MKRIYFQAEATMLAIRWFKMVRKRYNEVFDKLSRSSLPLKTDSVDIRFQHMLMHGSLYLFNKKFFNLF